MRGQQSLQEELRLQQSPGGVGVVGDRASCSRPGNSMCKGKEAREKGVREQEEAESLWSVQHGGECVVVGEDRTAQKETSEGSGSWAVMQRLPERVSAPWGSEIHGSIAGAGGEKSQPERTGEERGR